MKRMLVTDLDGTLAGPGGVLSGEAHRLFTFLGREGVLRVVATGRSLHSARQVIPADFPLDYLIFATGTGVLDWRTQEVLLAHALEAPVVGLLTRELRDRGLDFMVHFPVPDNHLFRFHQSASPREDFLRRLERHRAFATPLNGAPERASQFLTVCDEGRGHDLQKNLAARHTRLHVCLATSPLDHRSHWVEIFDEKASKSLSSAWIAARESVEAKAVLAVGNDYNDLDLLRWAGTACVVGNAPEALRRDFPCVASHDRDGVSEAVRKWLGKRR